MTHRGQIAVETDEMTVQLCLSCCDDETGLNDTPDANLSLSPPPQRRQQEVGPQEVELVV